MERLLWAVVGTLFVFPCLVSCQNKSTAPSATHNCPFDVIEASSLECFCVINNDKKSLPSVPTTVNWRDMMPQSERFLLRNVRHEVENVTLTCMMTWNGSLMTLFNYSLLFPANARVALLWGVGIGLGAGVGLMAIVAAALTVVLWRKGWVVVLPCAGKKRYQYENLTGADQCDVTPDNITESARSLPAERETGESRPCLEGQISVYDKIDETLMSTGSRYQALKTPRTNPIQKQRLKGTERREALSRSHGNEAADGERRDATWNPVPVKVKIKKSRKQTKKKAKVQCAVSEADVHRNSEDLIYNNLSMI